jgi:hypothetical protein
MSEETLSKAPKWFLGVAIAALIWNLLGVFAYLGQMYLISNPEMLSELPMDEQALYENTPMWATIGFTLAVWGGAIGSLLLLLKKRASKMILMVSFIGILIQQFHSFFISNNFEVYGPGAMAMPIMILIVGVALIWLADKGIKEGWIN